MNFMKVRRESFFVHLGEVHEVEKKKSVSLTQTIISGSITSFLWAFKKWCLCVTVVPFLKQFITASLCSLKSLIRIIHFFAFTISIRAHYYKYSLKILDFIYLMSSFPSATIDSLVERIYEI